MVTHSDYNTIDYLYDAMGNFAYTGNELKFIHTSEGRIVPGAEKREAYSYQYYLKDHPGSMYAVTNEEGNIATYNGQNQIYSFDPCSVNPGFWEQSEPKSMVEQIPNSEALREGRRRNPDYWSFHNVPAEYLFERGFTGHEHLTELGLINMPARRSDSEGGNGRMYDARLGRFLSPDNYVQMPGYSQNLNRYSYVLNNPLKYTDPSGEFFVIDSWLVGLFSGGWKEANKRAGNDIKIWGGLFASDPNKPFEGRVWETFSRFTWQLPQTVGGFVTSHSFNTFGLRGGVESVDYLYGATVVKTRDEGYWGVAQGSFIVGSNQLEADANNPLFQHEYGHYIQSQSMGWAYYPRVGVPSLRSARNNDPNHVHDFHPVEQDANRRAFLYFNENVTGFQDDADWWNLDYRDNRGWDFWRNSLNIDGSNTRGQYLDYQNAAQVAALDRLRVRAKWYDHASWLLLPIGGPVWVGLINDRIYNR